MKTVDDLVLCLLNITGYNREQNIVGNLALITMQNKKMKL